MGNLSGFPTGCPEDGSMCSVETTTTMTLKKCKTCNGCKAMFRGWSGHSDECTLGYDLEYRKGAFDFRVGYPGEPCPKPKTNMELVDAPRKTIK